MSILRVTNLTKTYQSGGRTLTVLDNVSFEIQPGDTFAIVGPSGSGKTTLLGLCAGLDQASSGSVYLNEIRLDSLNEDQRAGRAQPVRGLYLPELPTVAHADGPRKRDGAPRTAGRKGGATHGQGPARTGGLGQRGHHYPTQLRAANSNGCRWPGPLPTGPKSCFADEPTGNLDTETSEKVIDLILRLTARPAPPSCWSPTTSTWPPAPAASSASKAARWYRIRRQS
jgi:putative ABC transport system ATP-binding protein